MTDRISAEEMQKILDELVREGIAWKGEDGRYRMREDIAVSELPDGTVIATRKAAQ